MSLRLAALAAALAAALYAGWRVVDAISTAKVSRATETYNRENRDVADAVEKARQSVRDCHARGLPWAWERRTGQCVRAVPGAGK